jgi:hypothetical protein
VTLALLILLVAGQPTCQDLSSCREQAIAAKDAGDFEAFHDLAWAAFGKGEKNDPASMLLVARAQSLSGRPGDALVMLERIAALGGATDAATSDDFARVRALQRWPEVAAKLESAPAPPAKGPASASAKASTSALRASADKPADEPPAKAPASASAKATADKPPAKEPALPAKPPALPATDPARPGEAARTSREAPLSFTTVLTPAALAYDAVSRRYIIADRKARRVAIVDEHTGQVSTLVGAAGSLGDIGGMAIDPQKGDLWLVSTGDDDAPALHQVQLISGRVLSSVPLKQTQDPVALAFVRGAGLVLADTSGTIYRVDTNGASKKLGALEYVPAALASDGRGRLYISGGASRIGRYTVAGALRRVDTIELAEEIPPGAPFVVTAGRLEFVVPVAGSFELRSVPMK